MIFNYETAFVSFADPLYFDIGFQSSLTGNIPDSSTLGLATTGTIMTGITDWAVSDSNAKIDYDIALSTLAFTITTTSVTRTKTSYLWYR